MKKIFLISLILFLLGISTYAQKVNGTVKGVLQDSTSTLPLADATVSVVRLPDSTLISFTLTGPSGQFQIKTIDAGTYDLMASFTGLQTAKRTFTISASSQVLDMGIIKMYRFYKLMQE